ncbi:hypothetical protein QO239_08445 [Cupriavidus taiwanensis]|uniref:hypothetical protein n=1 Tax=Cupriavidus taiwanensis TaxID=164546 RepID=UPI00254181A4|nr:hypothetical protein [Cupriavidus taiwanensis]MDK3022634.1 hypothetical protein [Cupriavidus taiwanensis]
MQQNRNDSVHASSDVVIEVLSHQIERVRGFCYPLMYEDGNDILQFASCFFIRLEKYTEYLVSAGHALRDFDSNQFRLLSRTASEIIQIPANIASTMALESDKNDHIDISVIQLPNGFCCKHGINVIPDFRTSLSNTNGAARVLSGYPASRNKSVVSHANVLHLYAHCFVSSSDDSEVDFSVFKKSAVNHVAISLENGVGPNNSFHNIPVNPKGMSGGPVWRVSLTPGSEDIFLEGVFIEMHNRRNQYLGFATKFRHVLGLIASLDHSKFPQSNST